jgi:hypothetical protein
VRYPPARWPAKCEEMFLPVRCSESTTSGRLSASPGLADRQASVPSRLPWAAPLPGWREIPQNPAPSGESPHQPWSAAACGQRRQGRVRCGHVRGRMPDSQIPAAGSASVVVCHSREHSMRSPARSAETAAVHRLGWHRPWGSFVPRAACPPRAQLALRSPLGSVRPRPQHGRAAGDRIGGPSRHQWRATLLCPARDCAGQGSTGVACQSLPHCRAASGHSRRAPPELPARAGRPSR